MPNGLETLTDGRGARPSAWLRNLSGRAIARTWLAARARGPAERAIDHSDDEFEQASSHPSQCEDEDLWVTRELCEEANSTLWSLEKPATRACYIFST